ncbi:protein tyrosine phosphatase [Beijerinckiaceae bacterium]|nr:protein tyrosine phosphatase [Beijerinckiaceae bacterium]
MPRIHVCPLSKVPETVSATGARSLVTLIDKGTPVRRPREISPEKHLVVVISDIVVSLDRHILPSEIHVEKLLAFVRGWDQSSPLLIHCWAGVSRSTAAAFIAACALNPDRSEAEIAQTIRAKSPTATPNARLVAIADVMLERNGRMVGAVEKIGRGSNCFEGTPFTLELLRAQTPSKTQVYL